MPSNTSALSDQKVLITGATGFIGSHLCRRLADGGAEVHAVSRSERDDGKTRLRWWQGDLSDHAAVRTLLGKIAPDVIFHLAVHGVGAPGRELVRPTFEGGLVTTVNLLDVATELGVGRFIVPGSLEEPDRGDEDMTPSSPYAAAKWASSTYARMFHKLYRAPVVIPRIFMTYGPGQPAGKIIPYAIRCLLEGRPPELSSGRRRVDWIFIDDVVDGLILAAQSQAAEGHNVDLGSGELLEIRTVVEKLVEIVNPEIEPRFGSLAERPFERERVADTADAKALLGWQPAVSIDEGLKRTVAWYAEQLGHD